MEDVFNVQELTEYLRCSQSTVRKLIRNNEIPSFRIETALTMEITTLNK